MTRLRSLIKEILSSPKKKDCGCGCNKCGDKAPILTEGKFKSLISEGLQHHIDKKISLFESVYRIGSEKHLELIREARALWIRGIIEVSDDDKGLLETHLGHFGLYEGVEVPLDLPMVNENNLLRQTNLSSEEYQKAKKLKGFNADDYTFSSDNNLYVKEKKSKFKKHGEMSGFDMRGINEEMGEWPKELTSRYSDEYRFELEKVTPTYQDKPGRAKYRVIDIESGELKGTPVFEKPESLMAFADDLIKPQGGTQSSNFGESLDEAMVDYDFSKEELIRVIKQLKSGASGEIGMIKAFEKALGRELTDDEIRGFKIDPSKVGRASLEERINTILEAKKKKKKEKKDPPLNKPKRGGSKAYYVYVRDPKTKKIKKVSFGSGGLRAKIKNKQARNAFAARHNCKNKKDRTKAGYWSCNLPRYADQLGLGSKMNTFW